MVIYRVRCQEDHSIVDVIFCRRFLASPTPIIGVLKKFITTIKDVIVCLIIEKINRTISKRHQWYACICKDDVGGSPWTGKPVTFGAHLSLQESINSKSPGKLWQSLHGSILRELSKR